jgi:tripartite-type tricarboxylate transporter receptor subunit TctC
VGPTPRPPLFLFLFFVPPSRIAWPTKPVRILVGFPAGASPDLATRAIAEPLSKILRQPVVVENKPGASGNTVADLVAKATDDHTIGALINGNLTIAKLLNPKLPFDPEKDFAPVGLIGTAPLVLAVSGNAEGKTAAEQLLWVRNLGSGGKYGTPGVGTVGHLGMELIKSRAAITAQHKPYTGNPQVIAGLLANEIQLALLPPGLALPHIKSGKLKAIGVTSPERSALARSCPPSATPTCAAPTSRSGPRWPRPRHEARGRRQAQRGAGRGDQLARREPGAAEDRLAGAARFARHAGQAHARGHHAPGRRDHHEGHSLGGLSFCSSPSAKRLLVQSSARHLPAPPHHQRRQHRLLHHLGAGAVGLPADVERRHHAARRG